MDSGDLPSREIGEMVKQGILRSEEKLAGEQGAIPAALKNQNIGHNSKKTGLGPNTKR